MLWFAIGMVATLIGSAIKKRRTTAAALISQEADQRGGMVPPGERQARIEASEALLNAKGYRLKTKNPGWAVIEPLGGQCRITTLDELEQYASSRKAT